MAPFIPLAKWFWQKKPKLPALAIVKVAVVPVLVAMIGLVVSTVGGLLPPASGWKEKLPEKVTIVPVFTLMQAGVYTRLTPIGNVMVTVVLPVMSVAVVGSHPFTRFEPPLDEEADEDDELVDPDDDEDDDEPVLDEDDEPVLELLEPVELEVAMPALPPEPVSEAACVTPLPLVLLHAPIAIAPATHDSATQVAFFMPSSLPSYSNGPCYAGAAVRSRRALVLTSRP